MKILYIDDIPTPYRIGIHRRLYSAAENSYRVLFCASEEPGRSWDLDFGDLDYEIMSGCQFRPPGQVNPFSFKYNHGVTKEMERFLPDVVILSGYVHPTMWRAALWCRRNNVPYGITTESSQNTASKFAFKTWLKDMIMGPVIRGTTFGLPVSRAAGNHLRNLAKNQELAIYQFPNTPDITAMQEIVSGSTETIQERVDLRPYGVPPQGRIILFVGRLIEAKRPLDLLAAYQHLPDKLRKRTHLVFVGDGPLRPELSAKKRSSDSVFDIGWVSETEKLTRIMASCDLFVLPSSHEPWGAVVNEAMACGLPVLASDQVGAAKDMIVNNINGSIFDCGKITQITNLIIQYLQSAKLEDLRQAARRTAQGFGETFALENIRNAVDFAVSTNPHFKVSDD